MHTLYGGWKRQRREKSLSQAVIDDGYRSAMNLDTKTTTSEDAAERSTDTTDPTADR